MTENDEQLLINQKPAGQRITKQNSDKEKQMSKTRRDPDRNTSFRKV